MIILVDIEGTIADIAFVKEVLFPYARQALPDFVRAQADNPDVARELRAVAEEAGLAADDIDGQIAALLGWIDADRKITPLKALQGMVWRHGYEQGEFTAHLYPDAHAALAAWQVADVPLYVYSSGSIQAQLLYFAYSDFGDISHWFSGFFDTTSGPKREPASYLRIATAIGANPADILFLSDIGEELDAAKAAGLQAVQVCRPGSTPSAGHRQVRDLSELELELA
ncbi:MAG: acireductone synthase [Wenzhouxiangella sp.]